MLSFSSAAAAEGEPFETVVLRLIDAITDDEVPLSETVRTRGEETAGGEGFGDVVWDC